MRLPETHTKKKTLFFDQRERDAAADRTGAERAPRCFGGGAREPPLSLLAGREGGGSEAGGDGEASPLPRSASSLRPDVRGAHRASRLQFRSTCKDIDQKASSCPWTLHTKHKHTNQKDAGKASSITLICFQIKRSVLVDSESLPDRNPYHSDHSPRFGSERVAVDACILEMLLAAFF